MRQFLAIWAILLMSATVALAVNPDEVLDDPALEERARDISLKLRCLVCQNQSIDDSDADLAKDLRVLVRERLTAGDTDQETLDFIVARYGEYVLLQPRFAAHTLLLWASPLLALGLGIAAVFMLRRRTPATVNVALSADEEAAIEKLLDKRD